MKDPDRAVRRRASLLALGLTGEAALELGREAAADPEPEVRTLAALVLGASAAEAARPLLLAAMRDRDLKVRKAAAQSLSRLLGRDVVPFVELDEANRRREMRKLQNVKAQPKLYVPAPQLARVATVTTLDVTGPVLTELRIAIRGRSLAELATNLNQSPAAVTEACALLVARGQATQRGQKYFVA